MPDPQMSINLDWDRIVVGLVWISLPGFSLSDVVAERVGVGGLYVSGYPCLGTKINCESIC